MAAEKAGAAGDEDTSGSKRESGHDSAMLRFGKLILERGKRGQPSVRDRPFKTSGTFGSSLRAGVP
jgi:hypothetical protein